MPQTPLTELGSVGLQDVPLIHPNNLRLAYDWTYQELTDNLRFKFERTKRWGLSEKSPNRNTPGEDVMHHTGLVYLLLKSQGIEPVYPQFLPN